MYVDPYFRQFRIYRSKMYVNYREFFISIVRPNNWDSTLIQGSGNVLGFLLISLIRMMNNCGHVHFLSLNWY